MREDRMQLPMSFSFTSNSLTSKSHSLTHSLSLLLFTRADSLFSLIPWYTRWKEKVLWVDTGIHLTHLHHFFVQCFVQLHFIGNSTFADCRPSTTIELNLKPTFPLCTLLSLCPVDSCLKRQHRSSLVSSFFSPSWPVSVMRLCFLHRSSSSMLFWESFFLLSLYCFQAWFLV